ncbi:unnamed protein product [Cuscuta epithymum]|uniref:RING-type domain-containing protein n=1 Tax=Cuscuta epithymum TaxID=186058 RepID=A0AAV0CTU2_9ASTE|nr:unnamed protein product [Cuscuta epithymum]CAH9120887.1 unnamed protein product [Cuscuta epithymum]
MDTATDVNTNLELGLPQVQVMANIDVVDDDDDDVLICSPRRFAEAKEKARRNCPVIEVLDDETEAHQGSPEGLIRAGSNRRRRDSRRNGANIVCIDLEAPEKCKSKDYIKQPKKVFHQQAAAQPPAPPALSCPVCMAQLVEETSTKCGHIFCKKCIVAAIAAQGKCPTCRRNLKAGKDTFRVYLPTSY